MDSLVNASNTSPVEKQLPFKIVDSFLFSEVYEKELLLLKFILESPFVSEWVILENAYSFQGEYKGLQAKQLIEDDQRFQPFIHRVTVISREMQSELLDKNDVLDDKAFNVEYWQRDLAHDYFFNKYADNDWIIISDVDEMLDLTDATRCHELFTRMNSDANGMLHVSTKRYWFDFDNEYKILYGIPMCTKKYLQTTGKKLHDVRVEYHANLKMNWNKIIGFEYSSCFDAGHIVRKLETGAHMAFTEADLKQALRCNHRIISPKRRRRLKPTDEFFLDTIELDNQNSPKYVRDNLRSIKTYNIDQRYHENRRTAYPHLFSPLYKISQVAEDKSIFFRKKFRFLMRRLRLEKLIYE